MGSGWTSSPDSRNLATRPAAKHSMKSFARLWVETFTKATPGYWWMQAGVAFISVAMGTLMLERMDGSTIPSSGFLIRASLDALLFLGISHLGMRPLLRLRYMHRTPGLRAWLLLSGWLLILTLISMLIGLAIDRLHLTSMSTITSIRFQAGEDELGFDLKGGPLYTFALVNLWLSYAVWSALYLGWQAMAQRRKLQQQAQQARLAQLTHQLNPHFLFNAFNTIRGTIFEQPQRAADLITELSELFRFHLSQSERSTHSLEEEWRLAQRYLAIEQARLEQRLSVDVDLAPECLALPVPSLALLSLIENAIKHGIAPNPQGGVLVIRAQRTQQAWELAVSNDRGEHISQSGTGTGLANLRERLSLTYADRAQLNVQSDANRHVVRLTLPLD